MNAPRHRLYVDSPLAEAAAVTLAADQSHRLLHVLRAKRGDEVALFNGRDGEWRARLASAGKRGAQLTVGGRIRAQSPEPGPWLAFAPLKRGPLEIQIEKATELGAAALWPTITERTEVRTPNLERLRAVAIEAAEQCGRLTVPDFLPTQPHAATLASWPHDRKLLVLDETGGGAPIAEVLSAMGSAPCGFLVGPVGGHAQSELDALEGLPFAVRVDLGPRILRAETAAIFALACWQALCAAPSASSAIRR